MAGSPDMFASNAPRYSLRRQPTASVNFVTCHDGFTLNDLVSYDTKRNDANVEDNQDGTNDNRSWNCGSRPADDGPTADPDIATLRRRQQRNLLATLLLSRGVPMLLAGDERNRTQEGNNNAYCQDNPISWLDWTPDPSADAPDRSRSAISIVAARPRGGAPRRPVSPSPARTGPSEPVADTGLMWFNPDGSPVASQDWDNPEGHSFASCFPTPLRRRRSLPCSTPTGSP